MPRAALALLALAASIAAAQQPRQNAAAANDGRAADTRHLTIRLSESVRAAAAGRAVTLFVDVAPKPKMHVYAPEQKDYIPVKLTLTPGTGFTAGPARYPKPEKYFFAPLEETQLVYSKPFRIAQPIALAAGAAGPVTVTGTLRYQACDDAICYVPQDVALTWHVVVR